MTRSIHRPALLLVLVLALTIIQSQAVRHADSLYTTALTKFSAKDTVGLLPILKKITKLHPEFADGWELYGSALASIGQYKEAEKPLAQAFSLNETNLQVRAKYGKVLQRLKRNEAGKVIIDGMSIDPNTISGLMLEPDLFHLSPNPQYTRKQPAPTNSTIITTTKQGVSQTTSATDMKLAPAGSAALPDLSSGPVNETVHEEGEHSTLYFHSATGNCDVYIDSTKCARIDTPRTNELSIAVVHDVDPGWHLLQVLHEKEVWYNDKIEVMPGEHVKLRIEPGSLSTISRGPK